MQPGVGRWQFCWDAVVVGFAVGMAVDARMLVVLNAYVESFCAPRIRSRLGLHVPAQARDVASLLLQAMVAVRGRTLVPASTTVSDSDT